MKYYATINHTHVKYNFATVLLQGKCDLNGHTDVGKRVVGWGNTIHVVVVFAQFFFVQPFDISLVIFFILLPLQPSIHGVALIFFIGSKEFLDFVSLRLSGFESRTPCNSASFSKCIFSTVPTVDTGLAPRNHLAVLLSLSQGG